MVIKIPSMHIPRSLNTALSVSLLHPLSTLSSSVFVCGQSDKNLHFVSLHMIGPKWDETSRSDSYWWKRCVREGLVPDRTRAPASGWMRTSEQSAAEGGQKARGERRKKREADWSREGGSETCTLAWTLCKAAVDRRSLTNGAFDWASRLFLASLRKAFCNYKKAGKLSTLSHPCSVQLPPEESRSPPDRLPLHCSRTRKRGLLVAATTSRPE